MGCDCRTPEEKSVDMEHRDDLYMVVTTDTIGKDDDIGAVLMKGFFATMRETRELPHTIFFMNAGVKLTTVNAEVAAILKDMEGMGVEIYSCGTCLDHYDIEAKLCVGHRGSTTQVIEGINDFRSVWIK
jgi:selenium metabolism protein YedF